MTTKYSGLLCAGLLLAASGTAFAIPDVSGRWTFDGGLDVFTKGSFCNYTGSMNLNQEPDGDFTGTVDLQLQDGGGGLCPDPFDGFVEGAVVDPGMAPIKGQPPAAIQFVIVTSDPLMKGTDVLAVLCGEVDPGGDFMRGDWTTTPAVCLLLPPEEDKGFPFPAAGGSFEGRRLRTAVPALGPIGLGGLTVLLGLMGFAALRRRRD